MPRVKSPSLARLIWWSLRLSWSRSKATRRRCRQQIWQDLAVRWFTYVPDASPGSEVAIVRAVWLGAALASRSLWRYPLLPRRLKLPLTFVVRLSGKTNGKAIVAAYLAVVWLRQVATSAVFSSETWGGTGG